MSEIILASSLIYYPRFEPSLSWLRTALLFSDRIHPIIPARANHTFSDDIRRHLDHLPDTLIPIEPPELGIVPEYGVLALVHSALLLRSKDALARRVQIRSELERGHRVDDDDAWRRLELAGIVSISDEKVSYTLHEYLSETGSIYREEDGALYVDEEVAFVIVAFLASRLSRRLDVPNVTDEMPRYALPAVCDLAECVDRSSKERIALETLSVAVPADIALLTFADYLELRRRYADFRETLLLAINELKGLYGVEAAQSAVARNRAIDAVVKRLSDASPGNSNWFTARIGRSIPLSVAALVSIAADYAGSPDLSATAILFGLTLEILGSNGRSSRFGGRIEGAQSALMSLKKEIANKAEIERMVLISDDHLRSLGHRVD